MTDNNTLLKFKFFTLNNNYSLFLKCIFFLIKKFNLYKLGYFIIKKYNNEILNSIEKNIFNLKEMIFNKNYPNNIFYFNEKNTCIFNYNLEYKNLQVNSHFFEYFRTKERSNDFIINEIFKETFEKLFKLKVDIVSHISPEQRWQIEQLYINE